MKRLLKDPLLLFFAVGALIYILSQAFAEPSISYDIEVTEADINRISEQWQMQMRRPPNATELDGLVAQHVKEEIYYREAQRLNLQEHDTIVRRRLVQKLTFLTEDVATAVPLTNDELRTYFEANKDSYRIPPRLSFTHRYFSSDRRENAQKDAAAALRDVETRGDPFMLQRTYTLRSERDIGDLFGREFASALFQLEPNAEWQGPIESAYGWHPVVVTASAPSELPTFEAIAQRIAIDAQQQQRRDANEAYFERLRAQYAITYPNLTAEMTE